MTEKLEEWKKKYPDISIIENTDRSFISSSAGYLLFRRELGNCGAIQIGGLTENVTYRLLVALFDWCSIQGITVIYGSTYKNKFLNTFYSKYFKVIHEYISNREGDTMVYFMRVLKDPYAKGYSWYYGPLSDKSYLLSEEKDHE